MSCGCGGNPQSRAERDRRRTAAAMCILCLHRRGTMCGRYGVPVADAVQRTAYLSVRVIRADWTVTTESEERVACDRHPEGDIIRWLGLRWYGVPAPLRWFLRLLIAVRRVRPLTGPLDGCGCIVALRDRWDALRARLREWLAVARVAATGRI